jgi:hypothetical protein
MHGLLVAVRGSARDEPELGSGLFGRSAVEFVPSDCVLEVGGAERALRQAVFIAWRGLQATGLTGALLAARRNRLP